ncbi:disulfide bond formation protein B, partial [Candidatus Uhrbacteria bacterium]|nr:disulfide bond formation protein B [Candidatus Uhrbacteria bacterium]
MSKLKPYLLPLAFLQAVVAMAGSLFFSEVWHLAPCVLCWYQRITMYPLVVLTVVAMWRKDDKVYQYILPLSVIGFCISLYHNILYYAVNWGIRPDWTGPCQAGISCTTRYIEWGGFITIPLLSLTAHLVITVLMLL